MISAPAPHPHPLPHPHPPALSTSALQEKATSLEIASQLSEVVQTERLLQAQNRQVVDMLHDELTQREASSGRLGEALMRTEAQLAEQRQVAVEYEAALQDRLRASMDLEEEFHEKLLQHKFHMEELKQQKQALRKALTAGAAEALDAEVRELRAQFERAREDEAARAAVQRQLLEQALQASHEAAVTALRQDHKRELERAADARVVDRERLRAEAAGEAKAAAQAAAQAAEEGAKGEVGEWVSGLAAVAGTRERGH
jgi:hypothetical protein